MVSGEVKIDGWDGMDNSEGKVECMEDVHR